MLFCFVHSVYSPHESPQPAHEAIEFLRKFRKICANLPRMSLCLRLDCSPVTLFALKAAQRKREGEVTSRNCRRSTTHLNGRSRIAADSVLSPTSRNRILLFACFFTRAPRSEYLTFRLKCRRATSRRFSAKETEIKLKESAHSAKRFAFI